MFYFNQNISIDSTILTSETFITCLKSLMRDIPIIGLKLTKFCQSYIANFIVILYDVLD